MEGCSIEAKVKQLFLEKHVLGKQIIIEFYSDIKHKMGDKHTRRIINKKKTCSQNH